jgi:hypothetical protein
MGKISVEEATTYLQEYQSNGYNKAEAYRKVHPEAEYNTKNTTRYHNSIMKTSEDLIPKIMPTLSTPEELLGKAESIVNASKTKDTTKIEGIKLLLQANVALRAKSNWEAVPDDKAVGALERMQARRGAVDNLCTDAVSDGVIRDYGNGV